MSFVAFGHRPGGLASSALSGRDRARGGVEKSWFLMPAAAVEHKHGLTLLILDSPNEVILAQPKGHVHHMALHSLSACTTQPRTFAAATRAGTN